MSMQDVAIVIEELARVDGSVALTVASHNGLCIGHILLAGNDAQKRRYVPNLATGKWLGAWGLTEPSSGSDAAGAKTRAVKQGDTWILNGSKTFITQGSVGQVYVIIASTTPEKKQHGLTAFIVERGQKGFTVGKHIEKMGCHASDTAELNFVDVEVPADRQLGALDHGFIDTLQILDKGRIAIAAMALGLGRGALEAARAYAKERKQFGRPIADIQAIQFMLADTATELDAGAPAHQARRMAGRQRPAPHLRIVDREAVDGAGGDARLRSRHPDPRRLRLHARVPRRARAARLQAVRDRRGHQRGPAHGHREAPHCRRLTRSPPRCSKRTCAPRPA